MVSCKLGIYYILYQVVRLPLRETTSILNETYNSAYGVIGTVPTTLANNYETWRSYQLHYQLATPTTEIVPHEGELRVHEGLNQVEVFEGVVVRELVNPALQDTGKYIIGDKGLSGGLLKQPPLKFISLYKNLQLAGGWEIYTGVNMQGREKIFIHGEMFDPAAQYSVTYIALPEEFTAPCPDVQAELTVNLKTTVDSLVDELANVATKADVGINGIAMHLAEYATNAIKHDGSVPMISSLNFLGDQKGLNVKNGDSLSYCNIDFPELTTQDGIFRLFRMTNTTGNKRFTLQKGDGTFNVSFEILNGAINVLNGLYIKITAGSGSPEGLIVGAVGSIYLRTDGGAGTTLYVKQSGSGNTGWIAK